MNDRILITGAHGFLGKHVVSQFKDCDLLTPRRAECDVTNQVRVRDYFSHHKPNIVVHLAAACGGIGANVANPGQFFYENALMGLVLLDASRLAGVRRFVLVSTTCAYPQDAPLPLREATFWDGAPTGATRPYGLAKRLLHEACETYNRQYGFESIVLVPANLYGPGDDFDPSSSHVVAALIRRIAEAKRDHATTVSHWGSGTPTREFLYVEDAARAIRHAVDAPSPKSTMPINIGTGVETSIRALVDEVSVALGFQGQHVFDTSKPDGQPRRVLDVQRAASVLSFHAKTNLAEGVKATVEWYLRQA
jgi:GDP-L-fucose synthase